MPWAACDLCWGLQKPWMTPYWTLNTWDILIAKIDVQRIVQCKPKELQVVTECPRRRKISILNALNVLIEFIWLLLDIYWVHSFLLAAGKRTQNKIQPMRTALAEKASYWLVRYGRHLKQFPVEKSAAVD